MTTTSPPATSPARRAVTEPRVRGWWLVVLGLLAAAAYVVGGAYWAWRTETRLIEHGTPVKALIIWGGGMRAAGSVHAPHASVQLKYEVDGVEYIKDGYLGGRKDRIVVQTEVDIRVDRADPNRWTARTEPAPLARSFVAVWTLLPLTLLATLGGTWAWWRTLLLYRKGRREVAIVVDVRHASLAPASRLVRCTIPGATEPERVVTVYVPQGVRPQPGDELNVVHNDKGRAVAVDWIER